MKLSTSMLRGPVAELVRMTPAEWGLEDRKGPFRFEFVVRPKTEKFERFVNRKIAQRADLAAAQALGDNKAVAKEFRKNVQRPDREVRAELQEARNMAISELLVSVRQVGDGWDEELSEEEVDGLLAVPLPGADAFWVDEATAELDPEDFEEVIWKGLVRYGDSLDSCCYRFLLAVADEAARQRTAADEEEVADPLPDTSDSGPGNRPSSIRSVSSPPRGRPESAESAPGAISAAPGASGSSGAVETARAQTS